MVDWLQPTRFASSCWVTPVASNCSVIFWVSMSIIITYAIFKVNRHRDLALYYIRDHEKFSRTFSLGKSASRPNPAGTCQVRRSCTINNRQLGIGLTRVRPKNHNSGKLPLRQSTLACRRKGRAILRQLFAGTRTRSPSAISKFNSNSISRGLPTKPLPCSDGEITSTGGCNGCTHRA